MSNLGDLNFNASEVEPNSGFVPIPPGQYKAVIIESERKPTRDGNGQLLKFKLQICEGQYQNRTLFENLNIVSHGQNKDTTEKIAKGSLSAICRAVGVLTPSDTSELHMRPMLVTVGLAKDQNGEQQNKIKKYDSCNAAPVAVASGGSRPW